MHYRIERFKPEHLDKMEVRPELEEEFNYLKEHKEVQKDYMTRSITDTLLYKGTPIMIVSMLNAGFGTYMPLIITSKYAAKHKVAIIRWIYKVFEDNVGHDVRRFEAFVAVDDPVAIKFVKFFGFDIIGIKHCSSMAGKDQVILERIYRK